MDAKVSGPLNELGATEIVQKIARGEVTCEAVTRDCVARIEPAFRASTRKVA